RVIDGCGVRRGADRGRGRLHHPHPRAAAPAWSRFGPRQGARARLQGLAVARDLPRRDRPRLPLSARLVRPLCRRGGDLALSRSALREADRRSTLAPKETLVIRSLLAALL